MTEQEFTVRIPARNEKKNYHIMKFNASMNVDVGKWNQVRMVRENNERKRHEQEEMPEYGAGSEYGRAQKEEARRKKYGFVSKKYNPDAQPWLMRVGNKKEGKHYRGVREGGVSANTTYYVFTHAQDGSFEAHPIKEWYNFTPRVTYKTLDADEAEEKFAERGKILNHWAMMVNKKLKSDQDLDGDDFLDGESSGKKSKKDQKASKSLKISDMDDWADSDDGMDSDEDGPDKGSDDDGKKKKGKGKDSKQKKKKSKEDVEDENDDKFEDSDDGDGEDREVDYITDESSEDEEDNPEYEQKGVDQAKALSKLLDSESSSDDEEKKKSGDEDGDEDETGKKKKKKGEEGQEEGKGKEDKNDNGKDDKTKKAEKRKALVDNLLDPNAAGPSLKKSRMDPFPPSAGQPQSSGSTATGVESSFEEDVRRYLARKPMTTTEILKKIKSKKTGIQKDELMPLLVSALKRINPHKQKVKGVMYLSLKPNK